MSRGSDDESGLMAAERAAVRRPMRRLLVAYGRRYPFPVAVALAANTLSPLFALVPAFVLGVTIDALFLGSRPYALPLVPDGVVPATDADRLVFSVALVAGAALVGAVLTWAGSWGWTAFAERVQHDVRTDAYDRLQRLGMDFFTERQTGELSSVVGSDVNQLNRFLDGWLGRTLSIVVQLVGTGLVMWSLDPGLALVALVPAPVLVVVSYLFVREIRPLYRESRGSFGRLSGRIENNLSGIEVVKSFTTEPFEAERVADASREHAAARYAAAALNVRFGPSLSLVTGLGFALVLLVGGLWVVTGRVGPFAGALTVGTLVVFLDYTRQFTAPMTQAGVLLNNYEDVKASAVRVFALVDYPVSVGERADAVALAAPAGRVEFDGVSFAYPRPEGEGDDEPHPVVRDVSFVAEPGETVGLVGPTGSGKSTLAKLLLRLYDPDEGVVRVDGRDAREYTLASLRGAVGYVSQEPFLFSGTVRENIAYGAAATDAEVEAAARAAAAHEFIERLPDGYDTEVGQRGVKLSGGQRQRLAIARVVLKDPPILVLDEATSHVDNETELLIQRSLAGLIEGRTTFVIAHRLSTVRRADRVLVLDDGEIVERGGHEELLAAGGLYANLWAVQVGDVESLPPEFVARIAAHEAEAGGD
ncbi:ABC transporter ATP-binding protein [Halosegnis marinus]|uniref:ABC transporter ATP-binding protein n=1 Tax=Halosegnis marinus TaxID=3034023 RepID=A0ABD5ZLF8_9EURY|nr:ABC transporter ATP-binding protein [Halosegnis sp. DT85]